MRFIESILLNDGKYVNLDLHQQRVDRTLEKFGSTNKSHSLKQILPRIEMPGVYKVRVVYDLSTSEPAFDIEYAAYLPRKINSLQIVHSDAFDYSMKYEDREPISKLLSESTADDIIIAIDNHITDGSYFNIALWDGSEWYTPDTPLLHGVRRTQLIGEYRIMEKQILVSDLEAFQKVSLINAMLDLGDLELSIDRINV